METPTRKQPVPRTGSIKDKIVAPDLLEERAKRNFDAEELTHALYGGKQGYDEYVRIHTFIESDPILRNDEKFYEMTREEQMEVLFKKVRRSYELDKDNYYLNQGESYFHWAASVLQGVVRTH